MNCPHCNVHIDEHPASRCLDAWVAEAVMDGRPFLTEDDCKASQTAWTFGQNRWVMSSLHSDGEGASFFRVPTYTADIAAAWEVVEKINDDSAMTLRWYNPDGRTSYFSVAFGFSKKIEAHADAAPLAICRAAIKTSVRD